MPFWALWVEDLGLEVLQPEKWERRRDLSEVLFKVSTEHDPPYAATSKVKAKILPKGYILAKDTSNKYIKLGMFYGEIWESLQQTTNFSYWMVKS